MTTRLTNGPRPVDQVRTRAVYTWHHFDHHAVKSGAKLLDFGLAKGGEHLYGAPAPSAHRESHKGPPLQDLPAATKPLTAEATILGTFQYMAPEQVKGKEADARTDILALGMVFYEMVTGRPPFQGKNTASLITAILSSDPAPITTLQPMSPQGLGCLVKKCLAKDPDDRW